MAITLACALDFAPPQRTVVLYKSTKKRERLERCGRFVNYITLGRPLAMTPV
ncbi:MAG: hypothetical protein ABWY08_05585 [Comamonas sp.]